MKADFNSIIGILGTIFGLFGIIISIYSIVKSKKTKKLAANTESTVLISETLNKYENLKISYNNENIESLISSIVRIKNIGSDIVEPTDVAPSSPIIIKTTQKFLFKDASKYEINVSNSKNTAKLSHISETELILNFDFLNPKDEILITLLHTGDISVHGDLKSNPIKNYTKKNYEGHEVNNQDDYPTLFRSKKSFTFSLLLAMSSMILCNFILMGYSFRFSELALPILFICFTTLVIFFTSLK